jgi:hypothetical protein
LRPPTRPLKDAGVNYSDLQNDVRKTLARTFWKTRLWRWRKSPLRSATPKSARSITPSGAGSANRRAIIVDYARFMANPPQRRRRSRPLGDRFERLRSAGLELRLADRVALLAKFDGEFACGSQTYTVTGALRRTW